MQTFLPFNDPVKCAEVLDSKRLNKQILECYQILKVISTNGKAWRNHPAVLMWEGAESKLWEYTMAMVKEADKRGIKTTNNLANLNELRSKFKYNWGNGIPAFQKNKKSTSRTLVTHRVNLYHKDPEAYWMFSNSLDSQYNKPCCDKCKYYWPTHEERNV